MLCANCVSVLQFLCSKMMIQGCCEDPVKPRTGPESQHSMALRGVVVCMVGAKVCVSTLFGEVPLRLARAHCSSIHGDCPSQ